MPVCFASSASFSATPGGDSPAVATASLSKPGHPRLGRRPGRVASLVGLALGLLLCGQPIGSMAGEQAKSAPLNAEHVAQTGSEEVTRNEQGFPVPRKGPLVSEMREDLTPEVPGSETVIRRYDDYKGNTIREFSINGMLFQIEVTPVGGPTYYLIDVEGNGVFQERRMGPQPRLIVPQWVLFRF
ncbi:MAG: DUF2782 domain-containing protein [Magnetococcales bacterium]|nr:DUF2782 domain-containing protein [Magnetococcales bacterium]